MSERVFYCEVTGHLVGTDTRPVGAPCECGVCALSRQRDDIAFRVEHPEQAHLHYEGCPYKPFADMPDWDIPEDRPDCTCGHAAKGAYWKGQWMLERGYKKLVEQERDDARTQLHAAEQARQDVIDRLRSHALAGCALNEQTYKCPACEVLTSLTPTTPATRNPECPANHGPDYDCPHCGPGGGVR